MAKKLLIPLCLLLALVFSVQSAATATEPKMFKEDTVTFSQYTEGADAAFDGAATHLKDLLTDLGYHEEENKLWKK